MCPSPKTAFLLRAKTACRGLFAVALVPSKSDYCNKRLSVGVIGLKPLHLQLVATQQCGKNYYVSLTVQREETAPSLL